MAVSKLILLAVLAMAVSLTVTTQEGEEPECPPGAPWCPVWVPCNYTEVQGPTCQDCNNRLICTAVGGLLQRCWYPGRPYCDDGRCTSEPSEECIRGTTESTAAA